MLFNEKLRLLREARGLTQAELAARANLSRAAISLYESGARRVAYDDAPMLASALGVDRTVFDRDELWAEYEAALAQAKAILLDATNTTRDNHTEPSNDQEPRTAHDDGIDDSRTRDFCSKDRIRAPKVLALA